MDGGMELFEVEANIQTFIKIKVSQRPPPVKIFIRYRNPEPIDLTVYTSKTNRFPDLEKHDDMYLNPNRIIFNLPESQTQRDK
jgi:hypothetical protein